MSAEFNSIGDNGSSSVESLHRELIEARNLAIKTDNLVKNLSADIKQIAKRQDTYQRRYLFNSAVAYVLFVVVIFTGLFMVFNARVSAYEEEVGHYTVRNEQLQTRLDEILADLERRRDAENRAYAFWELIQSGRQEEVVEQFARVQAELTDRAMIELLRDRVNEIAYGLAESAYREGLTYMQNERWSEARDAFLESGSRVERTPWAPELNYNLGLALFQLEDYEGALNHLESALATGELDEAHTADARYTRAEALRETGRLAEAIEGFRGFRDQHPTHRMVGRALHQINRIQRTLDRGQPTD